MRRELSAPPGSRAAAAPARASRDFPRAIEADLGAVHAPPCSICHLNGVTGMGTVVTPFGEAMRERGLIGGDVTSLKVALDAMAYDQVDSNGNGILDVDEIRQGTDPNAGRPVPTYGCAVRTTATGDGPDATVALVILLGVGLGGRATPRGRRGPQRGDTRAGPPRQLTGGRAALV